MNLKCLFWRHDYRVVGEWRRPQIEGMPGLRPYGASENSTHVFTGHGIRVQCATCGLRRYAKFRRELPRHLWLSTGVDEYTNPQWEMVIDEPFSNQLVNGGPSSEEIAEEVGW